MTALATPHAETSPRRHWARALLWCAMPVLGLGYQISSQISANALARYPFGAGWIGEAVAMPSVWAAVGFELVGLVTWVIVLSEFTLSAAYSVSALNYVLVIGASWIIFHEPSTWLQILGGAAILTGIWIIANGSEEAPP